MQVFTPTGFASIDFAARRATVVEPHAAILRRTLRATQLSEAERQNVRERCFDDYLVKREAPVVESNAIEQELKDFAEAIRVGRAPRVTGADGRDAVAIAEMVLDAVREHRWDGADGNRKGPLAMPVLPFVAPAVEESWANDDTVVLRKAG
jgi:predicted dehydrogenase